MNVCVVVPCHIDDAEEYLPRCLESLRALNPQPSQVFVDINDGDGYGVVTKRLNDKAFQNGCDAVLQCSADFYLHPDILKYVSSHELVTFTPLFKHPCDLPMTLHRVLLPHRTWSGCYCVPKRLWLRIRDKFDGTDSSVAKLVGCWRVKSFKYRLLRPYRRDTTLRLVRGMSLGKRLVWQFTHVRAIA